VPYIPLHKKTHYLFEKPQDYTNNQEPPPCRLHGMAYNYGM